jgi:hypothetical protein
MGMLRTARVIVLGVYLLVSIAPIAMAQQSATSQRTPRTPRERSESVGAMQGRLTTEDGLALVGAEVVLSDQTGKTMKATSDADGIFRVLALPAATYTLSVTSSLTQPFSRSAVTIAAGEVTTAEIVLKHVAVEGAAAQTTEAVTYRELPRRPLVASEDAAEPVVPDSLVLEPRPDRWGAATQEYRRYPGAPGESPFILGRWYDPFNRNKLKGDYPIWGQKTFFSFTGVSFTAFDARRLPTPSGVGSANADSEQFFGKPEQAFVSQTFRLSFDLFHGDTSAFRPADWRVDVTPAFNINYLATQENGIVNRDVREGTDRMDMHAGLQEAFAEYRVKDIGPNFDFVAVRAGIQEFTSDFRGLIFADEQPGVRIFGNLESNRIQYNAAYFQMLEKDTNSGLNTFHRRHQQVVIGNVYIQDALFKGYTAEFSYHFDKDDADIYYDRNGFLVRPAPIGLIRPHNVRAHYIGWTGNGHMGRVNVSNAFYQALGHDDLNPIARRPADINAQLGALELSLDRDWLRYRVSALYASGDGKPGNGVARGFDSIVDGQAFAGGIFSFFDREGIRLTQTGVALTSPGSFLPDLRASKEEGQANFVNPGLMLFNAGADIDITPKWRGFVNASYLRFVRTEPLQLLLFQGRIRDSIGMDYGVGATYRPALSENMSITAGVTALSPGRGLRDIYFSKTMPSAFTLVRFQF